MLLSLGTVYCYTCTCSVMGGGESGNQSQTYTVRPRIKEPINQVNFLKTEMIIRKSLHCYKIQLILSFDTSYKMYWPCMAKQEPFQMVMSKLICAEWEFKGLTGSAAFRTKGRVEKTFISISFVSFVRFFLLRLLILTWIN